MQVNFSPKLSSQNEEKLILLAAQSSKGEAMTTYIFFEDALRMFTNAYLLSAVMLIAVSGIGLAVIETIEKTGER